MSDRITRLTAALSGRYVLGRELGAGGMATVYAADDAKHGRTVAVKVMRPELAAAIGPDRFLREIEIAAKLSHPNILPMHDSGEVDGMPYYVMPFVDGESVRDRLDREGQLPIDDALRIARDVGRALGHAHEKGVVHRDIKPENILLTADRALVADFGIARAVDAADQQSLTQTGLAIGTPAYMSPEQATADRDVGGRTDIYALGCVLYEMLVGEPPYTGPNAQAIIAKRFSDPIPSAQRLRETTPDIVDAAIFMALAKAPADRFATANDFVEALEPGVTASAVMTRAAHVRRRTLLRFGMVSGAAAIGAAATVLWMQRQPAAVNTLDPAAVAVLPFRVTGDSSLAYLRDGMTEFLTTRLNGEGGPEAADPSVVANSLASLTGGDDDELSDSDVIELAHELGVGHVLRGGLVGSPTALTLTGSLTNAVTGEVSARTSVRGTLDELTALVDRLTAHLLSLHAGEGTDRLSSLSPSLPAVQAFLEGRRAEGEGRYLDARGHYGRAIEIDSTFALAGLGIWFANSQVGDFLSNATGRTGRRIVRAHRGQLSERDRALFPQVVDPTYRFSGSRAGDLVEAEERVDAFPNASRAWILLAKQLFWTGPALEVENWRARAARAFDRALAIDSVSFQAIEGRIAVAALMGDTATVRRWGQTDLVQQGIGEYADFLRWRVAVALDDEVALTRLRAQFSSFHGTSVRWMTYAAIYDGLPIDDADSAAAALVRRSATERERTAAMVSSTLVAGAKGRMGAVEGGPASILLLSAVSPGFDERATVIANRASGRLGYGDACVVELWRLARDDSSRTRQTLARLQTLGEPNAPAGPIEPVCPALLDAWLEVHSGVADAPALSRVEAMLLPGPHALRLLHHANFIVAGLHAHRGDYDAALRAIRRRQHHAYGTVPAILLASFLAAEGRYAALVGDTAAAVAANRHYLALRTDPDPAMEPEVAGVRAALDELVAVK